MAFPNIPINIPPPKLSPEAPGTRNLPVEFSAREEKRLETKKESKRVTALDRAGKSAFSRLNSIIGDDQDKDVQLYSSLSQEDMRRLTAMYGQDEVARYVKAMEKKRFSRS